MKNVNNTAVKSQWLPTYSDDVDHMLPDVWNVLNLKVVCEIETPINVPMIYSHMQLPK